MKPHICRAKGQQDKNIDAQREHKREEVACKDVSRGEDLPVVALADTSADPDAVVVKLVDAVVAHVAVGGTQGPEDEARLAELESGHLRGVHLLHCLEEYSRLFASPFVLLRKLAALDRPDPARNDSGVSHRGP